MTNAIAGSPVWRVKETLKCSEEEAEAVVKNLGRILSHEPTKAFVAMAFHLSNTTRTPKATRDDILINEGKRQAGLFIVACAKAGLDLNTYSEEER